MTSLMFGTLSTIGVPADEKVVRSTATPVERDAPPAMATDMPLPQEVETDHNPNLGMVNRQVSSKWIDRMRSTPFWLGKVSAGTASNAIINEKVSSSGYAASQEEIGNWGHGTMPAAIGIEPVSDLTDGGKMGNEYFKTHERDIQETAGAVMQPPTNYDQGTSGAVSASGKVDARKAAMAGMYNTWWNGGH